MTDLAAIEARYAQERDQYAELAKVTALSLTQALSSAGVLHRIEHRAKAMASLLKKAVVKQKTYDEIGDKAGVRIVLALPTDRARAVEVVRATALVAAEEDKRETLGLEEFGYSGMHFEVTKAEHGPLRCEVQLHTPGEALWSSVTHDMSYKALLPAPPATQRAIFRMRALTEVFDAEIERVATILGEQMNTPSALALQELEPRFLRLAQKPYNAELSIAVIDQLLRGDLAVTVPGTLGSFCDDNAARLSGIFTKYGDSANPFLTQPEAMLIFYLLSLNAFAVRDAWQGLPQASLEEFEAIWGVVGSGN